MDIRPSTSQERRLLFIETLLNATDKISKVSPNSVNSGVAGGVAKLAGRAEKDIILALSELFPDLSFGDTLDQAAKNLGFTTRLGAYPSTTYVRVVADPGTVYSAGVHVFNSTAGINFNIQRDVTVGQAGFAYVPVTAASVGAATNVDALTISKITPQPSGHQSCVNEYAALNGSDTETDEMFRARIKDGGNLLAKNTLAMIQAVAIAVNPKVLKVYNYGRGSVGKINLAVSTQNGELLTDSELAILANTVGPFLSLIDSQWHGTSYLGIQFVNVNYAYIDISFRGIFDGNTDDIRQKIQIAISKYLDFRTFDPITMKVEWDNLLEIVKNIPGVKYIPDQFFYPRVDVAINTYQLPRLRGFLMLDMNGGVIVNQTGSLSPVYYPNQADFSYQSTVLQSL